MNIIINFKAKVGDKVLAIKQGCIKKNEYFLIKSLNYYKNGEVETVTYEAFSISRFNKEELKIELNNDDILAVYK